MVLILLLISDLTIIEKSASIAIMNQNAVTLKLRKYMNSSDGWGREQGVSVYNNMLKEVESSPEVFIFRISMENVNRIDASFPRESIMELAKRFRGKKGFCLTNIENKDIIDNLDAAANKKEQPMYIWSSNNPKIIGPNPTSGLREILEYVLSKPFTTTHEAAQALALKITNASTKLKQLVNSGYLVRDEESSPSGGKEYIYYRIK